VDSQSIRPAGILFSEGVLEFKHIVLPRNPHEFLDMLGFDAFAVPKVEAEFFDLGGEKIRSIANKFQEQGFGLGVESETMPCNFFVQPRLQLPVLEGIALDHQTFLFQDFVGFFATVQVLAPVQQDQEGGSEGVLEVGS